MGRREEEEYEVPARPYLLCHFSHRLHAGSVQVAVVLAGLNELVRLNVLLHFFPGRHKVVIPAIYLILPLGPCRICQEVTPRPEDLTTIPLAQKLPVSAPQRAQLFYRVLQWKGPLGRPRLTGTEPPSQNPLVLQVWPQTATCMEHESGGEAPLLCKSLVLLYPNGQKWLCPHLPPPSQVPALTRNTGSKFVGELREKIIIGTVLGGPKDDDGASIVH